MNALIFFVVILGIDIFLKSIRDKKKIEESRRNKMEKLKKKENIEPVKKPENRVKREVAKNPTISKKNKEASFFGEGKSYKDDHEGYQERYEERYDDMSGKHEERYDDMSEKYDVIDDSYKGIQSYGKGETLYDKDAIGTRERQHKDINSKDYVKKNEKVNIPIPKASTLKKDVLNGIIFSEILGKPKSMQEKDI